MEIMNIDQNVAQWKFSPDNEEVKRARHGCRTGGEERFLPAMPIKVLYQPNNVRVGYVHDERGIYFLVNMDMSPDYTNQGLSAFALRTAFLNVKTPVEAVDFMQFSGNFMESDEDDMDDDHPGRYSFAWTEFQEWQQVIRLCMEHGRIKRKRSSEETNWSKYGVPEHLYPLLQHAETISPEWWNGESNKISLTFDSARPSAERKISAVIQVNSTFQAICAACYVDNLVGVQYALCAGTDCNNLFEITSKHTRAYCSQPCAHKASVRRRRAAAKAAQAAKVEKPKKGKKDA